MKRGIAIAILALLVLGTLAWWWWRPAGDSTDQQLVLYGNVDLREVQLAFDGSERIASLAVEEGQAVAAGDLLGTLDQTRLQADRDAAAAALQEQREVVSRLENGSRPEEIRQARAALGATDAELANARLQLRRARDLVARKLAPEASLDDAQAAADVAAARQRAAQASLDLALAGPRQEDVQAARARLQALDAQLRAAETRLARAELHAPAAGVIRNRLLEPGDMATPQRPVYSLALRNPLWVRAYVDETRLGQVRPGQAASITTDSFPGEHYAGWVGYISPTAEFTPKSVETPALRSSLVYQLRVFACDPRGELRLGMPATVTIDLAQADPGPPGCPDD